MRAGVDKGALAPAADQYAVVAADIHEGDLEGGQHRDLDGAFLAVVGRARDLDRARRQRRDQSLGRDRQYVVLLGGEGTASGGLLGQLVGQLHGLAHLEVLRGGLEGDLLRRGLDRHLHAGGDAVVRGHDHGLLPVLLEAPHHAVVRHGGEFAAAGEGQAVDRPGGHGLGPQAQLFADADGDRLRQDQGGQLRGFLRGLLRRLLPVAGLLLLACPGRLRALLGGLSGFPGGLPVVRLFPGPGQRQDLRHLEGVLVRRVAQRPFRKVRGRGVLRHGQAAAQDEQQRQRQAQYSDPPHYQYPRFGHLLQFSSRKAAYSSVRPRSHSMEQDRYLSRMSRAPMKAFTTS